MSQQRRVVVTGLGILSPLGLDLASSWDGIVNGRSGIGPITHFDASAFPTRIAGEVKGFDASQWIAPKDVKKMDPFVHYGVAASLMAMRDAGLEVTEADSDRIGVAVGAGIGGLKGIEETTLKWASGGPRKISPFYVPSTIINMIAGQVSIITGAKGPNIAAVTACTTATHNIGLAMRMIQYGDADAMIAGGAEFATTPTSVGGFCAMKALSTRNDEPERASRPFDAGRDGFVFGEGSAVLMLESERAVVERGAAPIAELAGYGATCDAYHVTQPDPEGAGAISAMRAALDDAGLYPEDVDYLNAHGTSTPHNDRIEAAAIREAFGPEHKRIPVSSTKSLTGHLLGAAGAVEAAVCALTVRDGKAPATANLEQVDPDCELEHVIEAPHAGRVRAALSNSFGFGGQNACLVLKEV